MVKKRVPLSFWYRLSFHPRYNYHFFIMNTFGFPDSGAGDMEQNPTMAEQGTKAETVAKMSMAPGPLAVEAVKPTPTTRQ